MRYHIYSFFFLLLFLQACQSKTNTESTSPVVEATLDLTNYDSKSYSISYPSTWNLSQFNQYAEAISILDEPGKMNIQVQVSDHENATLEKLVERFSRQIVKIYKDAEITQNETLSRTDLKYHQIVFASKVLGDNKNINQYYSKDGKGFFLSFTCKPEDFDGFQSTALKILNSFQPK